MSISSAELRSWSSLARQAFPFSLDLHFMVAIWIKIPTQYLVASKVLFYIPVAFKTNIYGTLVNKTEYWRNQCIVQKGFGAQKWCKTF